MSNDLHNPVGTVTHTDGQVQTSFSIPEVLWRRVRLLATDRRVTAQSLWLEAMSEYLDRQSEIAA